MAWMMRDQLTMEPNVVGVVGHVSGVAVHQLNVLGHRERQRKGAAEGRVRKSGVSQFEGWGVDILWTKRARGCRSRRRRRRVSSFDPLGGWCWASVGEYGGARLTQMERSLQWLLHCALESDKKRDRVHGRVVKKRKRPRWTVFPAILLHEAAFGSDTRLCRHPKSITMKGTSRNSEKRRRDGADINSRAWR